MTSYIYLIKILKNKNKYCHMLLNKFKIKLKNLRIQNLYKRFNSNPLDKKPHRIYKNKHFMMQYRI